MLTGANIINSYTYMYMWTGEKDIKTWSIIAVILTTKAVVKWKPEKNSGLNGIWGDDLCDTGVVLYQLIIWELVTFYPCNVKNANKYMKDSIFGLWRYVNRISLQLYTQLKQLWYRFSTTLAGLCVYKLYLPSGPIKNNNYGCKILFVRWNIRGYWTWWRGEQYTKCE